MPPTTTTELVCNGRRFLLCLGPNPTVESEVDVTTDDEDVHLAARVLGAALRDGADLLLDALIKGEGWALNQGVGFWFAREQPGEVFPGHVGLYDDAETLDIPETIFADLVYGLLGAWRDVILANSCPLPAWVARIDGPR